MKHLLVATLMLALAHGPVLADTVKIGVIGPFSGPAALQGRNFQAGIEAYFALNGHECVSACKIDPVTGVIGI